jgi:hypothetical protein
VSAAAVAPDLVRPVVAFRAWRVVGERLMSPNIPVRWEGRTMHAECHPVQRRIMRGAQGGWLAEEHGSPHPDCRCGVYAHHVPGVRTWFGEFDWVEGIVTVWGRIEAHADGLRAEHARIEALIRRRELPAAERIAAALGCAVIDRDDVAAVADRYGAPLPATMIPSRSAPAR